MKKLISAILIAMMLVCTVPVSAGASVSIPEIVSGSTDNDYEYSVRTDGTVSIDSYRGNDSEVVIPDEIDGKTVAAITTDAFSGKMSMVSVKIPDTVNFIGNGAFENCTSLTEVVIPDGVNEIRTGVFEGCESLRKVSIPKGTEAISIYSFSGCKALESLIIDSENENYYVEGNCLIDKREKAVVFGFGNCSVPNDGSIRKISFESFGKVTDICEEIAVPEGVEVIDDNAFSNAKALKSITLPVSLRSIGKYLLPSADVTVYYNGTAKDFSEISIERIYDDPEDPFSERLVNENLFSAKKIFKTKIDVDAEYDDVTSGNWFADSVDYVVNKGIMFGSSDNEFSPNGNMTRAMLATVLWRLDGGNRRSSAVNPFTDLKADWYREAVNWAYDRRVVNGTSETTFSPNDSITREALATMLYRYAENKELDTANTADLDTFPDGGKVSDWAEDAVKWAVAEGIIGGREKGGKAYLDPQGTATRAEVAAMLMRFCEKH